VETQEAKKELDKTDGMLETMAGELKDMDALLKKIEKAASGLEAASKIKGKKVLEYLDDKLSIGTFGTKLLKYKVKFLAHEAAFNVVEKAVQVSLKAKKAAAFVGIKGFDKKAREAQEKELAALQKKYKALDKEYETLVASIKSFSKKVSKGVKDAMSELGSAATDLTLRDLGNAAWKGLDTFIKKL